MTPSECAKWMLDKLAAQKYLDQETVAYELSRRAPEHTYTNENGNLAITRSVLDAFRKLTSDDRIVWSRSSRQWRYREKWDKAGRMQD
ncbi:hypothetical protein At12D1_11510 [Agrobacterium tumefaciens]|uniref:DUF6953 family protein n=1 Tax=Agrobacterium tumefaciens TaxID=358 RepID=UPI000EF597C3|nr:hypothetical protein At12D1_11510 [Agrobacterium tumefaciens]